MNLFLFISGIFIFTFCVGKLFEKVRIPWIFAALFLGVILSVSGLTPSFVQSDSFSFMAELGMYFLLFIIGFEINLKTMRQQGGMIISTTALIVIFDALIAGWFVHVFFHLSWFLSIIVALSFSTVGEAILIPILDEFKITNKPLGQSLIGIGTLDDVVEIIILIIVSLLVSGAGHHITWNVAYIIGSFGVLIILTTVLTKFNIRGHRFSSLPLESLFLFTMFGLFLFLGVGMVSHSEALAALLAGIAFRNFIPDSRLKLIENELKAVCYGFFAPLFFVSVGVTLDLSYLTQNPVIMIALVIITAATKFLSSYLATRKKLGLKDSMLLGLGLSVRFSTGIIVLNILYQQGFINDSLYSIFIAMSIIFTVAVPLLFSFFLNKHLGLTKENISS